MAPSGRRRKTTARKPRTIQSKKKVNQLKNIETPALSPSKSSIQSVGNSVMKTDSVEFDSRDVSANGCSTPKAQRFRIPEIITCPPAPKKQRVLRNCSLQRAPIAFFAPPDLELFFFTALSDISV